MKETERKPDITYYKNLAHSVSAVESEEAVETTKDFVTAALSSPNNTTSPGGTVMFIICLENTSDSEISGVTISDNFSDAHMKYLDNSAILHIDGCEPQTVKAQDGGEAVSFLIDRKLTPGERLYLSFVAQVNDEALPISLYNYAMVSDNCSEAKVITNSVRINSEYGKITAERTYVQNDCSCKESMFAINLKNTGNKACSNVVVKDTLPAQFSVSSIYYNGTALLNDVDYTYIANELTIKIPSAIEPSETANITVNGRYNI